MSELAEFEGTSMRPPVVATRPATIIRYGGIQDEQGTTSGLVWAYVAPSFPAGAALAPARSETERASAAAALAELRRLTGFTWEQVARVLAVAPRTPFLWTGGKAINKANEERLQRLVALLRRIDRGSPDANRAALLGARSDGVVPFDLLARGAFDEAEVALSVRPSAHPVARQVLQDRRPQSVADRMSLSDEKLHSESGAVRKARSVRVKKGE